MNPPSADIPLRQWLGLGRPAGWPPPAPPGLAWRPGGTGGPGPGRSAAQPPGHWAAWPLGSPAARLAGRPAGPGSRQAARPAGHVATRSSPHRLRAALLGCSRCDWRQRPRGVDTSRMPSARGPAGGGEDQHSAHGRQEAWAGSGFGGGRARGSASRDA